MTKPEVPHRLAQVARLVVGVLAWPLLQLLLLVLGAGSLLWNLLAWVLYPLLGRDTGRRLGRWMISFGYACFWRIAGLSGMLRLHAQALDSLRDTPGLIVAANHPSMLDALMLVARLPRSACIMKASLMRNPFLGPGARLARYIRNDSPRGMVRLAVADLQSGGQLVLFPEGTRSTQVPLNPLQPAVVLIAARAQTPIQLVFIDTDSPYLAKGWPLWRLPPLPIVFTVRLGPRVPPPAPGLDGAGQRAYLLELEQCFQAGVRVGPASSVSGPMV